MTFRGAKPRQREKQRVLVADDDVLLRKALAGLLERSGFEIAGHAGDAKELIRVAREERLERLTQREAEVLALVAEGASNPAIAKRLWVTEGTVDKHVRSILPKARLPETPDDRRRVLAVLAFLDSR
jgi:DNA-binding NarL/FixJ family response regulator